jgi:beta-galactosidase
LAVGWSSLRQPTRTFDECFNGQHVFLPYCYNSFTHAILFFQVTDSLFDILLIIFPPCTTREILTLTTGWKFYPGSNENAASINCNEADWKPVTIPHDWAIAGPLDPNGDGNTGKLPWKGEGWYRYSWSMPSSMKGKRIILLFDGVMAFPQLYVNGQLAGKWDYGYNSFYVDVTDKLNANGKNIFAVHADTRQHDSRWYPGAWHLS